MPFIEFIRKKWEQLGILIYYEYIMERAKEYKLIATIILLLCCGVIGQVLLLLPFPLSLIISIPLTVLACHICCEIQRDEEE